MENKTFSDLFIDENEIKGIACYAGLLKRAYPAQVTRTVLDKLSAAGVTWETQATILNIVNKEGGLPAADVIFNDLATPTSWEAWSGVLLDMCLSGSFQYDAAVEQMKERFDPEDPYGFFQFREKYYADVSDKHTSEAVFVYHAYLGLGDHPRTHEQGLAVFTASSAYHRLAQELGWPVPGSGNTQTKKYDELPDWTALSPEIIKVLGFAKTAEENQAMGSPPFKFSVVLTKWLENKRPVLLNSPVLKALVARCASGDPRYVPEIIDVVKNFAESRGLPLPTDLVREDPEVEQLTTLFEAVVSVSGETVGEQWDAGAPPEGSISNVFTTVGAQAKLMDFSEWLAARGHQSEANAVDKFRRLGPKMRKDSALWITIEALWRRFTTETEAKEFSQVKTEAGRTVTLRGSDIDVEGGDGGAGTVEDPMEIVDTYGAQSTEADAMALESPDVAIVQASEAALRKLLDRVVENDMKIRTLLAGMVKEPAVLDGLEHSEKQLESAIDKIISDFETDLSDNKKVTVNEVAERIKDLVRYTVVIKDSREYTKLTKEILAALRAAGLQEASFKNLWNASPTGYRGVNTRWRIDGYEFEIQFHTPTSVEAKGPKTHKLKEKERGMKNQANAKRREIERLVASGKKDDGTKTKLSNLRIEREELLAEKKKVFEEQKAIFEKIFAEDGAVPAGAMTIV
ncbi:hypothetical protein [Streptomyces sp. NPDC089919]|uniref:hypothetical protein n=1 Tax=Streptomyces sp. NPDC089919 TaxID=3155188 RepID=UPI0034170337